jgi:uncharacterized protein YndB with AHSA1/START domain
MITQLKNPIQTQVTVNATLAKAWDCYTNPKHITQWTFASDDWCCPSSTNDLIIGGIFTTRMEAKDGSFGFDMSGFYTVVENQKQINYTMSTIEDANKEDTRHAEVHFESIDDNTTEVTVIFEPENENPIEMQQEGWQAILNNYKKHTESC